MRGSELLKGKVGAVLAFCLFVAFLNREMEDHLRYGRRSEEREVL